MENLIMTKRYFIVRKHPYSEFIDRLWMFLFLKPKSVLDLRFGDYNMLLVQFVDTKTVQQ